MVTIDVAGVCVVTAMHSTSPDSHTSEPIGFGRQISKLSKWQGKSIFGQEQFLVGGTDVDVRDMPFCVQSSWPMSHSVVDSMYGKHTPRGCQQGPSPTIHEHLSTNGVVADITVVEDSVVDDTFVESKPQSMSPCSQIDVPLM